ncbi:transposase [Candidatus Daviesbacteria bacterium]|nr:transposase [Candidatus Daviesbacteria bacterium]
MPHRIIPFAIGEYYHLYNRGLEKQNLFTSNREFSRFIEAIFYYQIQNPKPKFSMRNGPKMFPVDESKKIVDILCYCLMPNHFHLLVRQIQKGGISEFMRKLSESTTKYRNIKYNRQGPLFQGAFKAVHIETDEQLIHVSRYIHLNPLVAFIVKDLKFYPWSSYLEYIALRNNPAVKKEMILSFFKSPKYYEKFVLDQASYGKELEMIKHAAIDAEF